MSFIFKMLCFYIFLILVCLIVLYVYRAFLRHSNIGVYCLSVFTKNVIGMGTFASQCNVNKVLIHFLYKRWRCRHKFYKDCRQGSEQIVFIPSENWKIPIWNLQIQIRYFFRLKFWLRPRSEYVPPTRLLLELHILHLNLQSRSEYIFHSIFLD